MTIRIKFWCDSGANIHSCREGYITTDELGITDEEWNSYTEEEKTEMMKEVAWENLDWGWSEE
jgi:hypothetical protein